MSLFDAANEARKKAKAKMTTAIPRSNREISSARRSGVSVGCGAGASETVEIVAGGGTGWMGIDGLSAGGVGESFGVAMDEKS
jgi:hypothetical protein